MTLEMVYYAKREETMGQRQSNQFGGVAVFIVVGVVLAALLGGGIYLSKQQGRSARLAGAPTNGQQTPETENQPQEGSPSPEQTQPPVPNPSEQNPPQNQPQNPPSGGTQNPSPALPGTGPTHIAETGPSDMLVPLAGLSLGAAGVVSYRRSRARLVRSALK